MPALRKSPWLIGVGLLALLWQLLLPAAHAAAWAQRGGDPLMAAFCGKVPAALAQKLRAALPAEVLRTQPDHDAQPDAPACDLCVSLHAAALAGPPSAAGVLGCVAGGEAQMERLLAAPAVRQLRLAAPRAPPLFS